MNKWQDAPGMGSAGRIARPATEADFAPDVTRDKGYLAQIVDQQQQILSDLRDLTGRLERTNNRIMGHEGKEVGPANPENVRPPAELDAASVTLMELQKAIGYLHHEVLRAERL